MHLDQIGESGSEDYRYTGKHEDPNGLYYFGARYYDPATGRFTTRDTVFGDLENPQSQNRYVYCRNNPHKYVDPDGRWTIQVGYGGSEGHIFGGISSTVGVAWGTDNVGEIEQVYYSEIGTGPQIGAGASINPEISISLFGDIEDIEGGSFTIGADASVIVSGVGFGVSIPIKEDNSLDWIKSSIVISLPWLNYGAEVKVYARPTYTVTSHSQEYMFLDESCNIEIYSSQNEVLP